MESRDATRRRFDAEMLELAEGLHQAGVMPPQRFDAFLKRCGADAPSLVAPDPSGVRALRDHAGLDREAFGGLIGLSASQIARFERGEAVPKGPAAKLIDLIRRKGVDAVR